MPVSQEASGTGVLRRKDAWWTRALQQSTLQSGILDFSGSDLL